MIKAPKFTVSLPVSGQDVKARPFLIREQKILLQAIEIGDKDQVVLALDDIMKECTFNEVDIDMLPVPDVEFLMLHIRSKSVGDAIKLSYTCNNPVEPEDKEEENGLIPCHTNIPVVIQIEDVKIDIDKKREKKIIFDDGIGLQLRDIPYGVYKVLSQEPKNVENTMKMRNSCIESVFDNDSVWTTDQYSEEDLNEFVDNLYTNDYEKIEAFIRTMPILKHSIDIECPKCGHKEKITLRGLDDFLA